MQPINILTSTAVPLPLPNIDTDQIIPKQFLKRIERTGYEEFLFYDWRYDLDTPDHVSERKDFVLNQAAYKGAEILLAEKNFGCGSSREHAAWAIFQYGFRAVIAPSFADIFFSNAGKNGIVLVRLSDADVETLMERSTANPQHRITINLEQQTVVDDQGFHATFDIDPFRKECLLNGWDDIGLTLRHADELTAYETEHNTEFWLAPKSAVKPEEIMNRPGYPSQIVPLKRGGYQKGWDARLNGERWWHLSWLEASWRAGWKDAGKELVTSPELAKRVAPRI